MASCRCYDKSDQAGLAHSLSEMHRFGAILVLVDEPLADLDVHLCATTVEEEVSSLPPPQSRHSVSRTISMKLWR